MSDTDLTRLAELEKAATPGPWTAHTFGHRSVRQASGAVTRALFQPPVPDDIRSLMTDLTWVQTDDINVALTGNGPKQTDNAAFIAALRNAAPSLIAEAREAARLRHVLVQVSIYLANGNAVEAHNTIRAALTDSPPAEEGK